MKIYYKKYLNGYANSLRNDSTLSEIDEALRVIKETGNKDLVLLQCITNYPSKIESANINVLKTYKSAFDVLTGYSDHSAGDVVILGATALGGCVVEKHFTLNKKDSSLPLLYLIVNSLFFRTSNLGNFELKKSLFLEIT